MFKITPPSLATWEAAACGGATVAAFSAQAPPKSLEPPPKSIGIAVLLAAFFGPLGMVYSTFAGAVIMLAISFPLLLASGELFFQDTLPSYSLLIAWPVCILWAAIAAESWNENRR